jgi:hypothetical protein
MALWGSKDSVSKVGTVTVDYANKTVTGVGTDFVASGVTAGDVITFGAGAVNGQAVIAGVTSATVLTIGSTAALSGNAISTSTYNISESPIYAVFDSNYNAGEIYGVDVTEVGVAATTPYAVTHAGWVGMTTYIDNHGNLRVKHEVLVAGSSIVGDANDDAKFNP